MGCYDSGCNENNNDKGGGGSDGIGVGEIKMRVACQWK